MKPEVVRDKDGPLDHDAMLPEHRRTRDGKLPCDVRSQNKHRSSEKFWAYLEALREIHDEKATVHFEADDKEFQEQHDGMSRFDLLMEEMEENSRWSKKMSERKKDADEIFYEGWTKNDSTCGQTVPPEGRHSTLQNLHSAESKQPSVVTTNATDSTSSTKADCGSFVCPSDSEEAEWGRRA